MVYPYHGSQGYIGLAGFLEADVPVNIILFFHPGLEGTGIDIPGQDMEGVQHIFNYLVLYNINTESVQLNILPFHFKKSIGQGKGRTPHRSIWLFDFPCFPQESFNGTACKQNHITFLLTLVHYLAAGIDLLPGIAFDRQGFINFIQAFFYHTAGGAWPNYAYCYPFFAFSGLCALFIHKLFYHVFLVEKI